MEVIIYAGSNIIRCSECSKKMQTPKGVDNIQQINLYFRQNHKCKKC